ncbi:MAG TPA: type IV toxin-antitoxin system AbiEi family antitoxin domain-containing protein [Puia sp.]|nr:type IV toxin-antitoxin system AbiEi family antitoxin domain-containing protein [Puia sp.]
MKNREKINQIFNLQPIGTVLQSSWLIQQGYGYPLQQRYRQRKWLLPIGPGAYARAGDKVSFEGAIYALQQQSNLSIHPAAGTAFYPEQRTTKIVLFGGAKEKLPTWFSKHDWEVKIDFHPTSFIEPRVGLINWEMRGLDLAVSSPARALMECLYLAPHQQDLLECYKLMEGLNDLQPENVQILLENCHSVKVKRLFLYMADKAGHQWLEDIDPTNIELGKGKRSIVRNGVYVDGYGITVPKELEEHGRLF